MGHRQRRIVVYALISAVSVALGIEFARSVARTHGEMPMTPATVEYVRNLPAHRCHELHPGDGAVIHADGRVLIRLYRDDDLVAECRPGTSSSHCAADSAGLRLEWTFNRAAERGYRWLTLGAAAAPSQGSFLADLAATQEHGAYAEHGEISVRP
jgi:hypothetical protein